MALSFTFTGLILIGLILGGLIFAGGVLLLPRSESKIAGIALLVIGALMAACPFILFATFWFTRMRP